MNAIDTRALAERLRPIMDEIDGEQEDRLLFVMAAAAFVADVDEKTYMFACATARRMAKDLRAEQDNATRN